jgi:hypothetical protein
MNDGPVDEEAGLEGYFTEREKQEFFPQPPGTNLRRSGKYPSSPASLQTWIDRS